MGRKASHPEIIKEPPLPSRRGRREAVGTRRGCPLRVQGEGRGEGRDYIPNPAQKLPADLRLFARELRAGQTDAENLLWGLLRNRRLLGFKFRRQYPFSPYILDFYCHELKLAIELDGGQHAEQQRYDQKRTAYLESRGLSVRRVWNNEMLQQTENVLEMIYLTLQSQIPSSPALLPPAGEGSV